MSRHTPEYNGTDATTSRRGLLGSERLRLVHFSLSLRGHDAPGLLSLIFLCLQRALRQIGIDAVTADGDGGFEGPSVGFKDLPDEEPFGLPVTPTMTGSPRKA